MGSDNHCDNDISSLPLSWNQQLAQSITEPDELLQLVQLNAEQFPQFSLQKQTFNIRTPLAYIAKMQPGNAHDPLLLQVMSQSQELIHDPAYRTDPVGDLAASKVPGLLHKYHGRVLLITTAACAVHCRYCFRRHFPYPEQQAERQQWSPALDYIRQDPSIQEVILSGGDPLVLSDQKLASLIQQLEQIPHLSRLRIHTRLPVVLPDRITPPLIKLLGQCSLNVSIVIHANHGNEITQPEQHVLRQLQAAGVTLLNQAVLLKQVNAGLEEQIDLSERLYAAGVLPYYLHLLDPVQGAAHFNVEEKQAKQLIHDMRERLPGFLVPRLVREIAGEKSKTPAYEL